MSKISIILPTYNVEQYIARALDSCINQTFKDIEIIIVDDCGSDKSIDIAKEYAKKDDRIKIIHNEENLKLLRARYEGVKVATSPYIMFLDPDDYLELNACEECVKILDKQDEVDLIWFDFVIKENDIKSKENKLINDNFNLQKYLLYIVKNYDICYWNLCSKLIKKDILINSFSYIDTKLKITMAEDALTYFFIVLKLNNIAISSNSVYYYCLRENSSTRMQDILGLNNCLTDETIVINTMSKYLKTNKIDFLNKCFLIKFVHELSIKKLHRKLKLNLIENYKTNYLFYKINKIIIKNNIRYLEIKILFIRYAFLLLYK